MEAGLVVT